MNKSPVIKIISGGQTGADQGGLAAAKYLGIETGGTAPYNYWTDAGANFSLYDLYGLVPGPYDPRTYLKRTRLNVKYSDGTVLFGRIGSPGTRSTINLCSKLGKPWIDNPNPTVLLAWVKLRNISILNVAGNRERTNPGIFKKTYETIVEALGEK
jgi:hypothetical protein